MEGEYYHVNIKFLGLKYMIYNGCEAVYIRSGDHGLLSSKMEIPTKNTTSSYSSKHFPWWPELQFIRG